MKNVFGILFVSLVALLVGCAEEENITPTPEPDGEPEPEIVEVSAAFDASATSVKAGESITFSDQSTGEPTTWKWTFEGGEPATSTEQNPVVSYSAAGVYDVKLTASNGDSESTETKSEMIVVEEEAEEEEEEEAVAVEAKFTTDAMAILVGGSVQFTDASTGDPTAWSWEFEGGNPATSDEQNPSVSYDTPGTYGVSLTVMHGDSEHTFASDSLIVVTEDEGEEEEEEEVDGDFSLEGMWMLEANSTDVLEGSVVKYDPETKEATLIEINMNTHCFEFGDIVWIDVVPTEEGFKLQEMYRNCITHIYWDSEIIIVDENTIKMTGDFQGEPFSRTWVRYECEEEYDLDTYLNGTWKDSGDGHEGLLSDIKIEVDLSKGQGKVVDDASNPICWEVGDLAWDEIEATDACGVYSVSGLVKDCVSEEREANHIRIVNEDRFIYQNKYEGTIAIFDRVNE